MILIIFLSIVLILEMIYFKCNNINKAKIDYYRDIPSNDLPGIVGMMVKNKVDGNDIIATILDLYNRDYIDIKYDINNKCIVVDKEKDRFLTLVDYENYLLDEMFKSNKEIILEEFFAREDFNLIFKNISKMISKRVDIKSIHKRSKKRLINKVNFLSNYIVLGFSVFFSVFYLLTNNFITSLILGYCISFLLFIIIKNNVTQNNYKVDELLISYSIFLSIIYFGLGIITILIENYVFKFSLIISIVNIIFSLIFIINLFIKKNSISDYIFIIYSIVSIIFFNLIGICISIIYFSYKSYKVAPLHISYSNSDVLDKWLCLKAFLNDFTLIKDRDLLEIKLWNKYLIYGIAMGVNKKVISSYSDILNIKVLDKNIIEKYYVENII